MAKLTFGMDHLGLTVKNVEESAKFFIQHLGFERIGGKADYPAIFLSDGTVRITLWQLKGPEAGNEFNRFSNVGLHHFALKVEDARLDELHERLASAGVFVEFSPELVGGGPSRHMIVTDPSGIRIEFIARKS